MPTYGCFRSHITEPDRTWKADYILSKGDRIEFWNRNPAENEKDTLIGAARLERGQTICDIASTSRTEPEGFYRAIFDGKPEKAYPILGQ